MTNAIALPLQPPVMGLGALALVVGWFSPMAGRIAAWPVLALLRATIWTVEWTARWPLASVPVPWFGGAAVALYYCLLLAWLSGSGRPQRLPRQLARMLSVLAGVVALMSGALYLFQRPDGRVHMVLPGPEPGCRPRWAGSCCGWATETWQGWRAPKRRYGIGESKCLSVPRLDARTLEQAEKVLAAYHVDQVVIPAPARLTDTVYLHWTRDRFSRRPR